GPTVLTHAVTFQYYLAPTLVRELATNVVVVKKDLDAPPESITVDGAIQITSPTAPLRGARVRLTTNFQSGEDTLSAPELHGLSVDYDGGTGVLTISGTGTAAHYQD